MPGGQGGKGKAIVMGMLGKGGDVITQVIPDRTAKTLMGEIREHVEPASEVHTDGHKGLRR
ncbi:MAG: transposase [Paracoccaceae bacterium]|jgi:transposase